MTELLAFLNRQLDGVARDQPGDPAAAKATPRSNTTDRPVPAVGCDRPAVRVAELNHSYGDGAARSQVLFDIDLEILPGQFGIVTGPSGTGKTTLLTLIGALRSVQHGSVEVLGTDLAPLGRRALVEVRRGIGIVFQTHNLFDALSAYQNVKMAAQLKGDLAHEQRQRIIAILDRLGLGRRLDDRPAALSTGECQRVAIARALVNRPKLILADEPTAALDRVSTGRVIALLKEMASSGSAILMVTHDHRVSEQADRIIEMEDGRIVADEAPGRTVRLRRFLQSIDLFKPLPPDELSDIAHRLEERRYRRGEVVIRRGDPGDALYMICSGAATKAVHGAAVTEHLGPGDIFGEGAILGGGKRRTTVIVDEDLETLVLPRATVATALVRRTQLREPLSRQRPRRP